MSNELVRGRDLRAQRIRASLTQAEVAERMGINRQYISTAELELTSEYVSADFAARYAAACEQEVGAA